jgi:putative ABC transport system substrate-binding protein
MGGDPIKAGLVQSFNRPGGNVTGVSILTNQLEAKRFGLLRELVPGLPLMGMLINRDFRPAAVQLEEVEKAARTVNQRIVVATASNDEELTDAFEKLIAAHVGALLVAAAPFFDTKRDRIVNFAADQRLPAIYQFREYASAGGLLSYGVSLTDGYRQFGTYAASILNGANPATLPVQQSIKFELVLNLKTARALKLDIPPTLLALADEVIE